MTGLDQLFLGSVIFGLGWGVIGLCPGPIFALVGMGAFGTVAALAGARQGTWLYGCVKKHLPH